MKKAYWIAIGAGIILAAGLVVWLGRGLSLASQSASPPLEDTMVTVTAVGDAVMHTPIFPTVRQKDGTYDFRPIFNEIRPWLSEADVTVGVLETQLSGPERAYTGYPLFNSPKTIADAFQWAGLDLVFTAHNHSLDQGVNGLLGTLAYLERSGLKQVGGRSTPAEARYQILEIKGLKLAFLSYTTITNGIPLPKGKEWVLNLYDSAQAKADIAQARAAGADGVIVALHSGVEYQRNPSADEQKMMRSLLEMGADIILGSHVHVVQPVESVVITDTATKESRTCFIAYSLGNFLSNQYWRYSDCGLGLTLKLAKQPDKPGIQIREASYWPLWVDRFDRNGRLQYRILRVTGPDVAASDPDISQADRIRIREIWSETAELLTNWKNKPN